VGEALVMLKVPMNTIVTNPVRMRLGVKKTSLFGLLEYQWEAQDEARTV
jgi:hypothetical protein